MGRRRKEKIQREERTKIQYMYMLKDIIMKPTKHCTKRGGEKRRNWEYNGGGEIVQSTPYGITTMKPPCIINVY
jgi:hypothetical protein